MKFINCWQNWSEGNVINVLRFGRHGMEHKASKKLYYLYFFIFMNFGFSFKIPVITNPFRKNDSICSAIIKKYYSSNN